MMAVGVVLVLAVLVRIIVEVYCDGPIPEHSKWKCGITLIAGLALVAASLVKFLWDFMP